MKKRFLSLLLAVVMIITLFPMAAFAEAIDYGKVHVIVENTTFTSDKAPWTGVLVDKMVDLSADSTMMTCIKEAVESENYTINIEESQYGEYLTTINELATCDDAGAGSGWMGTLNDWFTNLGFGNFKVSDGSLKAGDEIRVMYTCDCGSDIGGDFMDSSDTSLASLSFDTGKLNTEFSKDTLNYTLMVPSDVSEIKVDAEASNKQNQVYLTVGDTEYRRTDSIPVTNGAELKIRCGDETNTDEIKVTPTTYTITMVTSEDSSSVPVVFGGVHSAQVASLKVYTYNNETKGDKDLLEGVEASASGTYTTSLKEGDYIIEGYDSKGSFNGSVVVTVNKDGDNTFTVHRAYEIYATNSGWVEGTDYTIDVSAVGSDKTERKITCGKTEWYGTERTTCLFLDKDTVTATFTPIGDKAETFFESSVTKSGNQTTSNIGLSAAVQKVVTVTINAPANSIISAGVFSDYYKYKFADSTVTSDENGVTAVFRMAALSSGNNFYRVQNPNGVTYWQFAQWKADATITVTADDLKIGSTEINKDSIFRYTKNVFDRADIYLNINAQGYKNMSVGETFELNVFRNWMAIENYMNSKVALPDMHYSVIDVNGNPSDVLTITPDENNNSVANMKANKNGTAIVLVTYDAMTHMQGQSSTASKEFSAIWPECTGVFIVTVGNDGSSVKSNMVIDRIDSAATAIDAEHDILFYLDDAGAEYSFVPEDGCTVTVARSTVTDKMTFSGFTSDGVTVDSKTGEVTVSGLTTGRHIIKLEKDGKANYQVVTTRQVSVKMLDSAGQEIADPSTVKAGDTIKLQFSNFVNPAEKLSGAYNFNASIYYKGEDGSTFKSNPGSAFGAYDFSGKPERQLVEVKIPKYWAGDTFSLHGAIKMGGFGNTTVGGHRGITYATGMQPNFNAPEAKMVISTVPDITLNLGKTDFLECKFVFKDDAGNTVDPTGVKVTLNDTQKNPVTVNSDGTFKALSGKFDYVINAAGYDYKTGTIDITDTDKEFEIILDRADENAWDGITYTEPSKDENGTYLISTGSELAWITKNASTIKTFSAKLTDDIDLAKYPWTSIDASSGKVEFDGDGHKIIKMNSTKGLFDTISNGGTVKNLTVGGTITATGSAGGIASYLMSGTIENCVNEAIINTTGGSNVGGIAGYMSSNAYIKNCANKADIKTASSKVGGVVGYTLSDSSSVSGCYNKGYVLGASNVGGIVGYDDKGATIENCYNHGKVRGTSNVGGIIGSAKDTTVTSCYNVGLVTGGNQFVGTGSGLKVTRAYYLRTLGTDEYAEALSDNLIKSADLDKTAFGATCNGYPALLWQDDVTFHKPSTAIVIKPLCDEKGYTAYLCENCGYGYQSDYTDPIGHEWCDSVGDDHDCNDCEYFAPTCTEEGYILRTCMRDGCAAVKKDMIPATGHTQGDDLKVYPAYITYTCPVCKEHIKVWNDERLKYVTISEEGIEKITVSDDTSYPWIFNEENNRFESTNQGVNNGKSDMTIKFKMLDAGTLSFDYTISSERNYDKFTITLTDGSGNATKIANAISGENSNSYLGNLEAGEYTLCFSYAKDSSSNSGSDTATVSNIVIEKVDMDKLAADAVIAKIAEIGEISDLSKEAAVNDAKAAYDALTTEQKALVTNADVLENAITKIATIKAKPALAIDFINEKLTNLVSGTTYKVTADGLEEVTFTADGTTCDIRSDWFGKTVSVVALVESTTYSEAQTLVIPARPEVSGEILTVPASYDADDGGITFTEDGMEYSADGVTWTAVEDKMVADLAAGTYYVRKAATDTSFASEISTVIVEKEEPITGWLQDGDDWYYFDEEGNLVTGWAAINGAWYYLDPENDGVMVTGWAQIGGKWYYLASSGAMVTGWGQIGGKWYYFNTSGVMVTGWAQVSGKWYYFNANGAMLTGWQAIGGKWYYFNASGAMLTGWQAIGGKWYYFNASGAMLTGTQKINGKTYTFNVSGVWIA